VIDFATRPQHQHDENGTPETIAPVAWLLVGRKAPR